MPTGHRKWKCLVMQIHPSEVVALTALSRHSDAQRYYKIQEDLRHPKTYFVEKLQKQSESSREREWSLTSNVSHHYVMRMCDE